MNPIETDSSKGIPLGWRYTGNAAFNQLCEIVANLTVDPSEQAKDRELTVEFQQAFPKDRLSELSLETYPLGTGREHSFCWWLERGLQSLGHYAPGSSRGHLLFRQKDGSWYQLQRLSDVPIDQYMQMIADWHAKVVEIGGSDDPTRLDREDQDNPALTAGAAKALNFSGLPGRTLKVLAAYYPDRFFPINNTNHLERILKGFGMPAESVPEGAVARNLAVMDLYQQVAQPVGLTVWDFMRLLYKEFSPRLAKIKHINRLLAAERLFEMLYGQEGFASQRYIEVERDYKVALSKQWRSLVSDGSIDAAIASGRGEVLLDELYKLIKTTNLINYRYWQPIKSIIDQGHADVFLRSLGALLSSTSNGRPADIDSFVASVGPLLADLNLGSSLTAALRSIPTLALWLNDPEREFYVRTDLVNRVRKVLSGDSSLATDRLFTTTDYTQIKELVEAVCDELKRLKPVDMIDVQGFFWVIFSASNIWFGGTTYAGKEEHFQNFKDRNIFGVGYGDRPEIRALFDGINDFGDETRSTRRKELENMLPEKAERDAVLNLFDLTAKADQIIVAKSTFRHNTLQKSILRIKGAGYTEKEYAWDEVLHHTIKVDWRSELSLDIDAGKLWNAASSTLSALDLEKALDLLSGDLLEDAQPSPANDALDQAAKIRVQSSPQPPLHRVNAPLNLILHGPPGTGKTYRFLKDYAGLFSDEMTQRYEIVTFHPSFTYEEFVEGLRPDQSNDGSITYKVQPGVFRRLCEKARQDPSHSWAILIDELNRGNVASIFGELITLIEADKRDGAANVILPYSKEPFTVPGNLHIIGTMNTADRSIALLDVALRRRFEFEEVLPDATLLDDIKVEGVDLAALLGAINERLTVLYDRDHVIGHAWLLSVRSLDDLRHAFAKRIIPLLCEYFHDDWSKVCLTLKEDPEKMGESDFIQKSRVSTDDHIRLFGRPLDRQQDRILYELTNPDGWTAAHFVRAAG